MNQQTQPTVDSLLERGYSFLESSQFRSANLYFNRALDIEPDNHVAHFGLALVEYQCKNEEELYTKLRRPLSLNPHFANVIKYAGEHREKYNQLNSATLDACVLNIIENINKKDEFLVEKWFKHYLAACGEGHAYLAPLSNIKNNKNFFPSVVELYHKVSARLNGQRNDASDNVATQLCEALEAAYTEYLQNTLKEIAANPLGCVEEKLDFWANPQEADASSQENFEPLVFDSTPKTVSQRYRYLANLFKGTAFSLDLCKKVDYLYEKALIYCRNAFEKGEIENERHAFYEFVVTNDAAGSEERDFVFSKEYQSEKLYCACINKLTDNFSNRIVAPSFANKAAHFIKCESYTKDDVNAIKNDIEKANSDAIKQKNEHVECVEKYVSKALNFGNNELSAKLTKQWESYKTKLANEVDAYIEKNRKQLSDINAKVTADIEKEKKASVRQSIFKTIGALVVLVFSLATSFAAKYAYSNISTFINFPILWLMIAAIVGFAAYHIVLGVILKSSKKSSKHAPALIQKISIGAVGVINSLLAVASIALVIYTYANYPKLIGVVSIKTPEDFKYLNNLPACDFVLENDVDFAQVPFSKIGTLKGSLDGKGFSLKNLNTNGDYIIKTNKGVIKNLTFDAPYVDKAHFYIAKTNKGTFEKCSILNITSEHPVKFYGFAYKNKGDIIYGTTKNISFINPKHFSGVCYDNSGNILGCEVSGVAVKESDYTADGIAYTSSGVIAGCSVNAEIDAFNAAGIVSTADRGATIDRCSAAGSYIGKGACAGLVRYAIENATVTNSYSTAKLTLVPAYNDSSYIGGLLGETYFNDKGEQIVFKNCFFAGSIAIKRPETAYYNFSFGYGGAFVGDTTAMSYGKENTENTCLVFDSCFSVATSSLNSAKHRHPDSSAGKVEFVNCHATNSLLFPDNILRDTKLTSASKGSILGKNYLIQKLGFDTEIWDIKGGSIPSLKPYVYTPETDTEIVSQEG